VIGPRGAVLERNKRVARGSRVGVRSMLAERGVWPGLVDGLLEPGQADGAL
jgi:hypothetical protein